MPQEELERDLLSLLPDYNKGATRQIKEKEVYSAMKMYNSKAMLTQRERLEDWQGWEYKPIKRRGRKRKDHVVVMNKMKEVKKLLGEDINEGRPTAEQTVREWHKAHPDGKKADCIRDTGLSKPTVYRWWSN